MSTTDDLTWKGADGKTYRLDLEKLKGLQIFRCFPRSEDLDPDADFHPGMLVGLVPSPEENAQREAEHEAMLDAQFPQLYCDVCREEDEFQVNGGLKMCQGCLDAVI